jgi:hypothetical protein
MSTRTFDENEVTLLKECEHVATIPVEGPSGTAVRIVSLKGRSAAYAAVLSGAGNMPGEVLGVGDLLEPMLREVSLFAALYKHPDAAAPHREALALGTGQPAPPPADWRITPAQVAALGSYADGDFAWIAEEAEKGGAEAFDRAVRESGDGLLAYVLRELDTREGCGEDGAEMETATYRLQSLADELLGMKAAVESAEESVPRAGPGV